jgi:hypothetical protein
VGETCVAGICVTQSPCHAATASGQNNACLDTDGKVFFLTSQIFEGPNGPPLADIDIQTNKWTISVWATGDPTYDGMTFSLIYVEPGIAYIQLPGDVPPGKCPYDTIPPHRHPLRISAPQKTTTSVWGLMGGPANKQAGLWANLPDQTGGNWGAAMAAQNTGSQWLPVAVAAHDDMVGLQLDCIP